MIKRLLPLLLFASTVGLVASFTHAAATQGPPGSEPLNRSQARGMVLSGPPAPPPGGGGGGVVTRRPQAVEVV